MEKFLQIDLLQMFGAFAAFVRQCQACGRSARIWS